MEIILENGVHYRTRLVPLYRAGSFARCVSGNARFDGAYVVESRQAKHPLRRWLVIYQPASDTRQAFLLDRQRQKRIDKATEEGRYYQFMLDKEGGVLVWRCHSASGEEYTLTANSCTCPDHEQVGGAGIRCKHRVELENRLAEERGRRAEDAWVDAQWARIEDAESAWGCDPGAEF